MVRSCIFLKMQYFNVELLDAMKREGFTKLAKAYKNCKDVDVGFKRCGNVLVALRLPPRNETTLHRFVDNRKYAKFRAKYIPEVIFVYDLGFDVMIPKKQHHWQSVAIVYEVGKQAHPDKYDPEGYNVCSHGIHFFLTLEAAICYDFGISYWDDNGRLVINIFTDIVEHCIYKMKLEKKFILTM